MTQHNPLPGAIAALLLLVPLVGLCQDRPDKPNVILILADDMGYGDIGVHSSQDIPTPHIDRIAREGVRFTNAYANGSFCTPTRAALMSCRYQQRTGNDDLPRITGPLPLQIKTLPERLQMRNLRGRHPRSTGDPLACGHQAQYHLRPTRHDL